MSDPDSICNELPQDIGWIPKTNIKKYICIQYENYKGVIVKEYYEIDEIQMIQLENDLVDKLDFQHYWISRFNDMQKIVDNIVDALVLEGKR